MRRQSVGAVSDPSVTPSPSPPPAAPPARSEGEAQGGGGGRPPWKPPASSIPHPLRRAPSAAKGFSIRGGGKGVGGSKHAEAGVGHRPLTTNHSPLSLQGNVPVL